MQVVSALALTLVLLALIFAFLVERRRRRVAERTSRYVLVEVARLNLYAKLNAMSGAITHELRQPLGAILSNAEAAELYLAKNPPDVAIAREILGDIRRDDQRAVNIIDDLRGVLTTGEGGMQELDLNQLVLDAQALMAAETRAKGVVVNAALDQRGLPVRADPIQLQQVLLILTMNAVDALLGREPDKRQIVVQTERIGEAEGSVSIIDSGSGIPEDQLETVFDAFYTTKDKGIGLGLAIARQIVESCGGRIWAENRDEGGAVLRFTVPLATRAPATMKAG
ncbi:MAG TPA: HAMP domain-containing sensor histidine kinase [Candidatus Binataceae bacterium]|nr:HAMP domain-containing sensor histidine kinase [Candidatus Binataceae bacterium]